MELLATSQCIELPICNLCAFLLLSSVIRGKYCRIVLLCQTPAPNRIPNTFSL